MTTLLLKNVRPMAGEIRDVTIVDGLFADGPAPEGAAEIDGGGAILIPGLVEAHTHLDKSLLGLPWYRNEVGARLIDKITNERENKERLGIEPARQSERQAIQSVAKGSTHIRSHVDVDTHHGLKGIEGVMATRDRLKDLVTIELVAFPQSGMMIRPGTAELMDQAMALGCEVVGGLDPCGIDRDPKGHLDTIFGLAERYGRPVDIHLHERDALGAFSMELIIERTEALGMQGHVTVSHAFCLGQTDRTVAAGLTEALARAGVHIVTTAPAAVPVPAVRELISAGVAVGAGSDGIRDTWGPFGNADMLERAMFIALKNNFRRDDEVEMALAVCTTGGAAVMELEGYGLGTGDKADAVLIEGETIAEAVANRAPRRLVLKGGRVVAENGVCVVEAP
ncbi:amidohydrolase family protein [Acuticoccus sediminis]|uniref:amidohydrolase family protein n=1 Tax=Acuticoccus sediminis TaxID=2184697 RepID=UPI001CFE26ED|nr:amidohydrolase family protein [Acuticoccus sediminis]